jgi:hypothetical protein
MNTKSKRRERFENVAGKRVQAILNKLELLGNCSNKHNYDFDENDVRKMFNAIKERLKQTENKFTAEVNKKSKTRFEF